MEDPTLTNVLRRYALEKTQLEFALTFRASILRVLRNVRSVKAEADALERGLYDSLADWQKRNPRSYASYQDFQNDCIQVLYSLGSPDFRLFPTWMDKKPLGCLHELWEELAPFTPNKLSALKNTLAIELAITGAVESIDQIFPKS